MAVVKSVIILMLSIVGLVRCYEYCDTGYYCEDGYCCEGGTHCCDTIWGTGGYVGLGFGILVFVVIIAVLVRCCRRRYYPGHVYVQHPLPAAGVTVVTAQGSTLQTGYMPPPPTAQSGYMPPPPTAQSGYMPPPPTGQTGYVHSPPTGHAGFVNPMATQAAQPPPYSK